MWPRVRRGSTASSTWSSKAQSISQRADRPHQTKLEERLLEICRRHGLPAPRANAAVEGLEVDFLFPTQRLVVETDGWTYHRTRRAFEGDRQRDAQLARAGLRVLWLSERQLRDRAAVAATIRAVLRSSG